MGDGLDKKLYRIRVICDRIFARNNEDLNMKKRYKKPNICEIDFEILDLIRASGGYNVGGGGGSGGWAWDDDDDDEDSIVTNGGYRGIGF